jgi:predicted DNA binding CopG/RHH family protein
MQFLNTEEEAILASVELDEWQSVPDVAQEIERYQRYAQAQPDRPTSVNIELSASDLESLETLAQQSGISVSLLMSTVLHQFVASRSV